MNNLQFLLTFSNVFFALSISVIFLVPSEYNSKHIAPVPENKSNVFKCAYFFRYEISVFFMLSFVGLTFFELLEKIVFF